MAQGGVPKDGNGSRLKNFPHKILTAQDRIK